jgi:hypothetical protein
MHGWCPVYINIIYNPDGIVKTFEVDALLNDYQLAELVAEVG